MTQTDVGTDQHAPETPSVRQAPEESRRDRVQVAPFSASAVPEKPAQGHSFYIKNVKTEKSIGLTRDRDLTLVTSGTNWNLYPAGESDDGNVQWWINRFDGGGYREQRVFDRDPALVCFPCSWGVLWVMRVAA